MTDASNLFTAAGGRGYQADSLGFGSGRNWYEDCSGTPGMGGMRMELNRASRALRATRTAHPKMVLSHSRTPL